MWRLKLDAVENFLRHRWQPCGCSPLCVRIWSFNVEETVNLMLHKPQACGLSPVWIRMWALRWDECVKLLLHTTQRCGLSPEWVRIWTSRWEKSANFRPHSLHRYGCWPVWQRRWRFKPTESTNVLLQILQPCSRLSVVWLRMWRLTLLRCKCLWQTVQVTRWVELSADRLHWCTLLSTGTWSLELENRVVLWDVHMSVLLVGETSSSCFTLILWWLISVQNRQLSLKCVVDQLLTGDSFSDKKLRYNNLTL